MVFNDGQSGSLVSIFEEKGRLEISVSEHILRARFQGLLFGFILLCLMLPVFGIGYWHDIVKVKTWSFLGFVLTILAFILSVMGLFYSAKAIKQGEVFTFDRALDNIRHNSQRIAALSELQEVQLRIPPNHSSKPYPSVWIVTSQQKPIEVLDAGLLAVINFNSGFGGIGLEEMKTQMQAEAYVIARQIAQFSGVPVREVCR